MTAALVRIETKDGMVRWRRVTRFDHGTLCRAGGLAESITWFDVASSFADGTHRSGREISGLIYQGPKGSPPIGKITIAHEGEKLNETEHVEFLRRLGCQLQYT